MNLGTITLRGRPRNRRQDEVREDGRIVGGEGWQEKVHKVQHSLSHTTGRITVMRATPADLLDMVPP